MSTNSLSGVGLESDAAVRPDPLSVEQTEQQPCVHEQQAVYVYKGELGDIVIRQEAPLGLEDQHILLRPEHIPSLIRALQEITI